MYWNRTYTALNGENQQQPYPVNTAKEHHSTRVSAWKQYSHWGKASTSISCPWWWFYWIQSTSLSGRITNLLLLATWKKLFNHLGRIWNSKRLDVSKKRWNNLSVGWFSFNFSDLFGLFVRIGHHIWVSFWVQESAQWKLTSRTGVNVEPEQALEWAFSAFYCCWAQF